MTSALAVTVNRLSLDKDRTSTRGGPDLGPLG